MCTAFWICIDTAKVIEPAQPKRDSSKTERKEVESLPNIAFAQYMKIKERDVPVSKVGQFPPWSVRPPARLARALPQEKLDLYKRATVCAGQGYGLGALVYFRRLVEESTAELLELVQRGLKAVHDEAGLENLKHAREQLSADKRLAMAADLLPAALTAGGNPLTLLYNRYSAGIHEKSEAECLTTALKFRDAFDYLFTVVEEQIDALSKFKDAMRE